MTQRKMWFATSEYGTWVPCPQINTGMNSVRWLATNQHLNGGAGQRQSLTSHKEYSFSWSPQAAENLYPLLAFFDGAYGPAPYYFVDPMTETTNLLPPYWSAPWLAVDSAPSLVVGKTPTLLQGSSVNGYPSRSAVYTVEATDTFKTLLVPIPPGYTLHFGVRGTTTGTATVLVDGVSATLLTPGDNTRTNVTVSTPGLTPITLTGEGTLTLTGMIAQLLPTGDTVPNGGYIHGQGNSGVKLLADPTVTGYSAALKNASIGVSANFIETGAWG